MHALAEDADAVGAVGFREGNCGAFIYGVIRLGAEGEPSGERAMCSL